MADWEKTEYYKNDSVDYDWVKKKVTKKEWKDKFSEIPAYCFLRQTSGGIEVGFTTALMTELGQKIPDSLAYCDDEDLRIIDIYRKASNIFPQPFTEKRI